jgi:hypothetical protein
MSDETVRPRGNPSWAKKPPPDPVPVPEPEPTPEPPDPLPPEVSLSNAVPSEYITQPEYVALATAFHALADSIKGSAPNAEATGAAVTAAMGPIVEILKANTPKPKITVGAYLRQHARAVTLNRLCVQNGTPMRLEQLTDREVRLLNQITHSGRYLNRVVEVIVREEGAEDETVELRWKCKSADDRNESGKEWRDLADMLDKIVTAQAEERAKPEPKRRSPYFGSKAYREAKANLTPDEADA